MRIECVDPVRFHDQAGRILRESWQPPCVRYTPELLRWHFGFPGAEPACAVAAFADADPIGFAAVVPRRLRQGQTIIDVGLLSFVAVRPGWRGQGVASALYKELLTALSRSHRRPIIAFAEPASMGQRRLESAFEQAGYQSQALGCCRAHATSTGPADEAPRTAWRCDEPRDASELQTVLRLCNDPAILWNDPTIQQIEYDQVRGGLRRRAWVIVRDPGGTAAGAALLACNEFATPQGDAVLATIEGLFPVQPSVELLRALIRDSGNRWAAYVTAPILTAANPQGIDPTLLRRAGLRGIPSRFDAHLFFHESADHSFREARATNLEVI